MSQDIIWSMTIDWFRASYKAFTAALWKKKNQNQNQYRYEEQEMELACSCFILKHHYTVDLVNLFNHNYGLASFS